jgi:glycine C-acetyltransferase
MVVGALKRLEMVRTQPELRENLWKIVHAIQDGFRAEGFDLGMTKSPVTPVYIKGGVQEATNIIVDVREKYSIFCSGVTYPVIPKGQLLLRIIPTAVHSMEDVEYTLDSFKKIKDKLATGEYANMEIPDITKI